MQNNWKNKWHLISRTGFGPDLNLISQSDLTTIENLYHLISQNENYKPLKISGFDLKMKEVNSQIKSDKRRAIGKYFRNHNLEIIKTWQNEMLNSPNQLQEKMAFFWHGHFATRTNNSLFNQQIVEVFRKNGLGNFKNLLMEVSKAPGMIKFLNNQQNRKLHPNENFARELMELFTMGRDNYTEKDVKEAARAFTGWGLDLEGNFIFKQNHHDSGEKIFLGKTGKFDGNDILQIILEQPQTALFITTKLYKFFVNDQPDEKIIKNLADLFYNSGYEIKPLLDKIFLSDWFYSEANFGVKVKSPVELFVGIRRVLPMKITKEEIYYKLQDSLGQKLLFPPNVSGWPSGKDWIDSSSLLLRMKTPEILTGIQSMDIQPPSDDDVDMGKNNPKIIARKQNPIVEISLEKLNQFLNEDALRKLLPNANQNLETIIKQFSRDQPQIKQLLILMCTPEYQLC